MNCLCQAWLYYSDGQSCWPALVAHEPGRFSMRYIHVNHELHKQVSLLTEFVAVSWHVEPGCFQSLPCDPCPYHSIEKMPSHIHDCPATLPQECLSHIFRIISWHASNDRNDFAGAIIVLHEETYTFYIPRKGVQQGSPVGHTLTIVIMSSSPLPIFRLDRKAFKLAQRPFSITGRYGYDLATFKGARDGSPLYAESSRSVPLSSRACSAISACLWRQYVMP